AELLFQKRAIKSTRHRDKSRLYTEDSRSAAKLMQPSPPPHHGVDSRRAEAMRDAKAAGGVGSPYGEGYAVNSSQPTLIETYPGHKMKHPIPAHPAHPIGGAGGKNPNMKVGGGGRF